MRRQTSYLLGVLDSTNILGLTACINGSNLSNEKEHNKKTSSKSQFEK